MDVPRKQTAYSEFFLLGPHVLIEAQQSSLTEKVNKRAIQFPVLVRPVELFFWGWYFKPLKNNAKLPAKTGIQHPICFYGRISTWKKHPNIEHPHKTWVFHSWAPETMKNNRRKSGPEKHARGKRDPNFSLPNGGENW